MKTILVTLPESAADALLARYGGDEVDSATGEVTRTVAPPAPKARPDPRRSSVPGRTVIRSNYMRR